MKRLLILTALLLAPLHAAGQTIPYPDTPTPTLTQMRLEFDKWREYSYALPTGPLARVIDVCPDNDSDTTRAPCDYADPCDAVDGIGFTPAFGTGVLIRVFPGVYAIPDGCTIPAYVTLMGQQLVGSQVNLKDQVVFRWTEDGGAAGTWFTVAGSVANIHFVQSTDANADDATFLNFTGGSAYNIAVHALLAEANSTEGVLMLASSGGYVYCKLCTVQAADGWTALKATGAGAWSFANGFINGPSAGNPGEYVIDQQGTTASTPSRIYGTRIGLGSGGALFSSLGQVTGAAGVQFFGAYSDMVGSDGMTWMDRTDSTMSMTVADSGDGNPAVGAITPRSRVCLINCVDSDGCTVTINEAAPPPGARLVIVSTGIGTVTIAEATNVKLAGGASWVGVATDTLILVAGANDEYYEVSRSDNS